MHPSSPAGHRANNFDFVRLAAALCVLVSHQFALTGLPEPAVLQVHSLAGLGVLAFFSLSGYLVAQSWRADPHPLRFAARRLLRIWPGLAAVVLVCAFVLGPLVSTLPLDDYLRHGELRDYLRNLVFRLRAVLPMEFTGNALPRAVNGSLWTIPLELQCYLALALLGLAGLLRRARWMALLLALGVGAYAVWEARGDRLVQALGWRLEQRYLLEFGLFFGAGVLLQFFRIEGARVRLALLGAAAVLAAAAWVLGRPLLALWLLVPAAVVAAGGASTPVLRRAGRFGDLSYGLYIWAFPIQQTLIWLNQGRLSWGALLALTLAAVFAAAFASWHLVEKHALKLKPRRPARAHAAAGAATA